MKIVLLPLDERPCNSYYPSILPTDKEVNIVVAPSSLLSKQKKICDVSKLHGWLLKECKDADYAIISMDMLCYGGLIPSRIHHESYEAIIKRSDVVREIKKENPKIKIYANELIMRCPCYSLSVEEPDYYDECGKELFMYGWYLDRQNLGLLTEEEKALMIENRAKIKDEYLNDLLNRRRINKQVVMYNLSLFKDGVVDFFSIPQDDCAPYGLSVMDVRDIKAYMVEEGIEGVMMYPGADEVGLDLISRAINDFKGVSPKVYVSYATPAGQTKIPELEDRPINITIPLHMRVAGCTLVDTLEEANILYIVNCGDAFLATANPNKSLSLKDRENDRIIAEIKKANSLGIKVAIADNFYTNEGDFTLLNLLQSNDCLALLNSYSGWNTSSNTLGTATAAAVCSFHYHDEAKEKYFLFYRLVEDLIYMGKTRRELIDYIAKKDQSVTTMNDMGTFEDEYASLVHDSLRFHIKEYGLDEIYSYKDVKVSFPWHRTFEIFLEVI